jgi:WD40 repeat protein
LPVRNDGRRLATRSDTDVLFWDVSDLRQPKQLTRLRTKLRYVAAAAFLPDGKSLLISSGPEAIQWWNISDPAEPKFKMILAGSLGIALSHDGRELVSWGRETNMLRRWEVDFLDSKEPRSIPNSRVAIPDVLKFSPDDRSLVSFGGIRNIIFWDMKGEHAPVTLTGHTESLNAMAFTSDGKVLASGGLDRTIRLWDLANIWDDNISAQPTLLHGSEVTALAYSPDPHSKYLASVGWEDPRREKSRGLPPATLKLWNTVTRTELASVLLQGRIAYPRILFSPDGQNILFEDEGKVQVHTVPSLQFVTNWSGAKPACSDDGSLLVYAADDRIIRRNLQTNKEVTIGEAADGIIALALSPNGQTLVTSAVDGGALTFWDLTGSSPPIKRESHNDRVTMVCFSPDGQILASTSWDGTLGLWDVKSRRNLALLSGHKKTVNQPVFSPNGRTVATSSEDDTVRLWNLATHREVAVLQHSAIVWPLAFSTDGEWLASGSAGRIHFWHAPPLEGISPISALASTPRGSRARW